MLSRVFLTATVLAGLTACWSLAQEKVDKPATPKAAAEKLGGVPEVTAKAWIIVDGKTGEMLKGFNETGPRALASTTKIMTAHLVLKLAEADPKILDHEMVFSERAAATGGSSSKLREGKNCPSGNCFMDCCCPRAMTRPSPWPKNLVRSSRRAKNPTRIPSSYSSMR